MRSATVTAIVALVAAWCVAASYSSSSSSSAAVRHVLHSRGWNSVPANLKKTTMDKEAEFKTVWIALHQVNVEQLDVMLMRVSDPRSEFYGEHYSYEELQAVVSPPQKVTDDVVAWLVENGVKEPLIYTTGDSIRFLASVAVLDKLFEGETHAFQDETTGRRVLAMMGEWSIPVELKEHIYMVVGLSDFPIPKRISPYPGRPSVMGAGSNSGYSHDSSYPSTSLGKDFWPMQGKVVPSILKNQYNISDTVKASNPNTTQAACEFQGTNCFFQGDMKAYMGKVGLDVVGVVNILNKNTWTNTDCDGESLLDLQMLLSMGYGAQTWYWGGNDWIYDWAQQYLSLPKGKAPLVTSLSWGWMENDQCQVDATVCSKLGVNTTQYVVRTNAEMAKLGAMGYTIVVCTQDEGAPSDNNADCTDKRTPVTPIYPAASPYVLAVGATTLLDPHKDLPEISPPRNNTPSPICAHIHCSRGTVETTAMSPNAAFTSGGGFSLYASRPIWQNKTVSDWLAGTGSRPDSKFFNTQGRGYPDISAIGEQLFVYAEHSNNHFSGGTSGSTPITSGIMSLLNDHMLNNGMKPLGFVAPLIYMMGEAGVGFNDIATGNNTCTGWGRTDPCCKGAGYAAVAGWDPATGWGTPNYGQMIEYLDEHVIAPRKARLVQKTRA